MRLTRAIPVLLAALAAGCATDPAPPAGFVDDPSKMTERDRVPFQRAWVQPGTDWTRFQNLAIARVNTDHLLAVRVFPRGDTRTLANTLGAYFERKLAEGFRADPNRRFTVVSAPGPATLVLEIALVEVVPAVEPGNLKRLQGRASAAFEARLRDATTGDVLATIADRTTERELTLLRSVETETPVLRSIIDGWAERFVSLTRSPADHAKDAARHDLRAWPAAQ